MMVTKTRIANTAKGACSLPKYFTVPSSVVLVWLYIIIDLVLVKKLIKNKV